MKKSLFFILSLSFCILLDAQQKEVSTAINGNASQLPGNEKYSTLNCHSHNDYMNKQPFRLAWENHFGSIEADIWAVGGELLVAHGRNEIKPGLTLDSLYLKPIVNIVRSNKGKPWKDGNSSFQLLIDLKTMVEPTLPILVEKIKKYPDVFDPSVNPYAVRIVITGNRPDPSEFSNFPGFIFFDGLINLVYSRQELNRIALYSENIRKFTAWSGKGEIVEKERIRLQNTIDSIHGLGKKVRFWNAPDDKEAWDILMKMKVDFINTDSIVKLSNYLNNVIK